MKETTKSLIKLVGWGTTLGIELVIGYLTGWKLGGSLGEVIYHMENKK